MHFEHGEEWFANALMGSYDVHACVSETRQGAEALLRVSLTRRGRKGILFQPAPKLLPHGETQIDFLLYVERLSSVAQKCGQPLTDILERH